MKNQNISKIDITTSEMKGLFIVGGVTAFLTVFVAFCEMFITFLPGGNIPVVTVIDWFNQLQSNWFLGLRNLGLLNIFMFTLGIPMYFALYMAHNKVSKSTAALSIIISYIGVAVFFATNRAFSLLDLSSQYAQATSDAQRSIIMAAGQAMLAVGRSHSPGTFMSFIFGEMAGVLMSIVILRGKLFSKVTAISGIIGFSLLLLFEVSTVFIPMLKDVAMIFAIGGGLLNIVWLVLIGRGFILLEQK